MNNRAAANSATDTPSSGTPALPCSRRRFLGLAAGLAAGSLASPRPANRPVKLGINLSSFGRQLRHSDSRQKVDPMDLPQLVRQELDIRVLDVPSTTLGVWDPKSIDRFRTRAADAGCLVTNLKVNAHDLPFADRDAAVRNAALRSYRVWIRHAAALGARWLRPYPSAEAPDWRILVDSLAELADYAAGFGITLLVENYRWLESEPEAIPRLVRDLGGRVAAAPDTANWKNETVREAGLRLAFPLAVTADFKVRELDPDGSHPAYDLRTAFKIGRDLGFDGPWCIEHAHREKEVLLRQLRRIAAWLKEW